MTKHQSDIQDTFLNLLRKEGVAVTVYLIGGVSLRGTVRGFDAFTIELDTPGRAVQAVYKRGVASVVPQRPLRGLAPDGRAREEGA